MRIAINRDTRQVVTWTNEPIVRLDFTRGDVIPVEIRFIEGAGYIALPAGATGRLLLKQPGAFASEPKAAALSWVPTGSGRTATYTFTLSLDTTELAALFTEEPASIPLALEIEWQHSGTRQTTFPVPVTVANEYIRQTEGQPESIPSLKATEQDVLQGTSDEKWMTVLRTKQAITAETSSLDQRLDFLTANLDPAALDSIAEAATAVSALQTGVHSKYQLPAPDIFLRPWAATTQAEVPAFPAAPLQTLAAGAPGPAIALRTAEFTGHLPFCRALDLPAELLAARRLFLEFVILRGRKQFVPSAHYADGSWPLPWPRTFWTRVGDHFSEDTGTRFNIDRLNHLEITAPGALLPAWRCLNGRLVFRAIAYNTADGQSVINLPCPAYAHRGRGKRSRSYSDGYHLFRFAFRYVLWDPASNAGRGQIIPGPLSRPLVLRHHTFPFRVDHYASSLARSPRCTLAEGFVPNLMTVDFAK